MALPDLTYLQDMLVDGVRLVEGKGGLPFLEIENRFCYATISLLGGQILSFHRKGDEHPILFCSQQAYFERGKGIKGGSPVCWPWFGQNPRWQGAHGFARSAFWQVDSIVIDDCGVAQIDMSLPQSVISENSQWAFNAALKTSICCGKWLSIELTTENLGHDPIPLTQALHTYFHVGDISKVSILGCQKSTYLDNTIGLQRCPESGEAITFAGEVDRIYDNIDDAIHIRDASLNRTIMVKASGSRSAVVWNPWIDKSIALADFADEEYKTMVCVETANAGDDVVSVQTSHSLYVDIRVA